MSDETDRLEKELDTLRETQTPRISPYVEAFARLAEQSEVVRQAFTQAESEVVQKALTHAEINIEVRDQSEAIASLTEMFGRLLEVLQAKEMGVTVNVPKEAIVVELVENDDGKKQVRFQRDKDGRITGATLSSTG